jgi:hypothetical protein
VALSPCARRAHEPIALLIYPATAPPVTASPPSPKACRTDAFALRSREHGRSRQRNAGRGEGERESECKSDQSKLTARRQLSYGTRARAPVHSFYFSSFVPIYLSFPKKKLASQSSPSSSARPRGECLGVAERVITDHLTHLLGHRIGPRVRQLQRRQAARLSLAFALMFHRV